MFRLFYVTMATAFSLTYLSVLCAVLPSTGAVTTQSSSPDSGGGEAKFVGDGLGPAAIAGIGVAGGILIIALIGIAIYCCVRGRDANMKDHHHPEGNHYDGSSYTTGTSQVFFTPTQTRYPKTKYGSTENIKSTTSSQEETNGAYQNPAYNREPGERQSEKYPEKQQRASLRKARGKTGFTNEGYDVEDNGQVDQGAYSWDEKEAADARGSKRMSRREASEQGNIKVPKSAMKKQTQPNGILKTRSQSPNRSQASSTDASLDPNVNALIYGYGHEGKDQPNIKHKPVIERKRSRSRTRSHRSGSSGGHSRRSQSPDKKKIKTGRMYTSDVFIDERRSRSRSSGRRTRSEDSKRTRSERTSDSMDSGSSTTSQSRKVSMNPGGKRVHIKGEETDI